MQLGYLTPEGHLVTADTLGGNTLYKAYRVDAARGSFEFLGQPRPMENLGHVTVAVELHRAGWASPGEVVLRRVSGTLYRTRTFHMILGADWRSIRQLARQVRWSGAGFQGTTPAVRRPFLSTLGAGKEKRARRVYPPPKGSPFIVLFHDQSVKASERRGSTVRLFATEMMEFTDFPVGKLQATVEFPEESNAVAFASTFPRVQDLPALDASLRLEIDRSRTRVWGRRQILALAVVLSLMAAVPALLILLAVRFPVLRVGVTAGASIFVVIMLSVLVALWRGVQRESRDFADKWPRVFLERWAESAPARAGGFLASAREMQVQLDPDTGSLAPLDRFLRVLPADTFFGAMALDAAAYVGAVLLDLVGRPTDGRWQYFPQYRQAAMAFPAVDLVVSPLHEVRAVWEQKDPQTVDDFAATWSHKVQMSYAFQRLTEFIALGFLDGGWEDFDRIADRLRKDLEPVPAESHVLAENHYRVRRARYGDFEIGFVEVEVHRHQGASFVPVVAIPFGAFPQSVTGELEGGPRGTELPEDLAVVRLSGNELVPLGIQIRNYLDVGPALLERGGRLGLKLLAVADRAQVVSPRLRQTRSEAKDFLAPMNANPQGLPTSPYANFLGRLTAVGEAVNGFKGTQLWRLGLDLSGLGLEVAVRKDRCDGVPQIGHHLSGSVWLVADFAPPSPAPATYIR